MPHHIRQQGNRRQDSGTGLPAEKVLPEVLVPLDMNAVLVMPFAFVPIIRLLNEKHKNTPLPRAFFMARKESDEIA
jgi:hypothetical protein